MPSIMPAPDPTSHSLVNDPAEPDTRESHADTSKPLPPQSASRYTGTPVRHSVQVPAEEKDFFMPILKVADLILDPVLRRVSRGAREIDLTDEQFSLLYFLMRRAGTKVYPEELLEQQELGPEADRSLIEGRIGRLRAKIELPNEAQLIYNYGSLYQLGGSPARQAVAQIPKILADELDGLFERMQTPEGRIAMQAAYDASPEEMGKAAVAAARKRD